MTEWLIRVLRPMAHWWGRVCYGMEFVGVERVPPDGPIILAPNHVTYLDPIWITVPIERRIYYMAWDAIFRVPVLSQVVRLFGAFPVRLEGHDRNAMREARCHLAAGRALMIFPEGGRTTTGHLMPFKAGAFRLALVTGAAIVPVSIDGAEHVWPAAWTFPRFRGRIRITYHAPIPVERAEPDVDLADLRRRARALADAAHDAVASALTSPAPAVASVDREPSDARP
jgi:1-acyl-sn-glycerol-3-phosphate acyltransferase